MKTSQELIIEVCDEIKELLLSKNRKYGDSALNPVRIFSKTDTLEQIHVRMDDKLSRISSRQSDEDEDVFGDLLGYLVLRQVYLRMDNRKSEAVLPSPPWNVVDKTEGKAPFGVLDKIVKDQLENFDWSKLDKTVSAKPEDQYEIGN